ncbi:MAG TPA: DUF1127 domain-containing protein [Pseudolabrys sp.]
MAVKYPVLPIAGVILLRGFASLLALVTYWAKSLARARRNRRQASQLAALDRHMLADIGISRADLRDAFSEPFWEDPTALLAERAIERRMNRAVANFHVAACDDGVTREASGFRRPATNRPARHTV